MVHGLSEEELSLTFNLNLLVELISENTCVCIHMYVFVCEWVFKLGNRTETLIYIDVEK